MLTDFYAHLYYEDPKAAEEVEDEDFDIDDVENIVRQMNGGADPDDWEDLDAK